MSVQNKWLKPLMGWRLWVPPIAMSVILIVIAQYNFLAFHTLAELFAIVISFVLFALAWSTFDFSKNNFLLYLACGYLWIGLIDLMHAFVYKGMDIFVEGSGNLSVQFWLSARYLEAFLLLTASFASSRKQNKYLLFSVFGIAALALTTLILTGQFPTGFVEDSGLTNFKIYSEYLIDLILALALIALFRYGHGISTAEKTLVAASIVLTMFAELAFTFYVSVFGLSNLVGHIFKLFSFWLIFQAIVISNLKKPFFRLEEARDYNRTLFETSPIGLALCRMDGTLVDINFAYTKIIGRTEEETLSLDYWEITPEKYAAQEQYQLDCLNKTGKYGPYEKEYIDKNGDLIPVRLSGKIIERGGERLIWSSVEDISEQKEADKALKQSEERYAFAISGTHDGLWDWNIETNENYMSPRFEEILGYQESELESTIESFFDALHPSDAYRVKEQVQLHFEKHVPYNTEYRIKRKGGDYIWIQAKGQAVWGEDGKPLRMAGSISDISERKQAENSLQKSEARLKAILEIAPEAVIAIGQRMNIRLFNQSAERIFGYKANEVLGQPLDILIPERFRGRHSNHIAIFERSLEDFQLKDFRQEILGLRRDGTEFPASASVSKLEIDGEKIFTVMLHDLTERKRAEKALTAAKGEAEVANNAKSLFLAAVSHELRTPLNAILGFSQILTEEYFGPLGDKKYREYAKNIDTSGEHLLTLVNDLLDISTIEAGKKSLDKEMLSINEVIFECTEAVGKRAREGGISLMTNLSEDLPPIYADFRATTQIVLNLLSNAIKFTPAGGKVTVSAKAAAKDAVIEVVDTGKGIPADKLPELTDKFVRAEGDPYIAEKGWGLGLSITKSLIDLHDGELDIQSTVGEGTAITVTMPYNSKKRKG